MSRARWIANYTDGDGVRRIATFESKRGAFAHEAEIRAGVHVKPAIGSTVAELEVRIAEKAAQFVWAGVQPACYVYRHYDQAGDLIYVGVSLSPLRRNERHVAASAWRKMLVKILIEPFASREEALAAETAAIREEFPKFNKGHNRRRHPAEELARIDAEIQAAAQGEGGDATGMAT